MDNIKLRNLPNSQLKLNLLHIKLFLRAPENTVFPWWANLTILRDLFWREHIDLSWKKKIEHNRLKLPLASSHESNTLLQKLFQSLTEAPDSQPHSGLMLDFHPFEVVEISTRNSWARNHCK